MSLHDKMAEKAAAMGKSSSEFTAAAQSHANATWFWLVVAGIVWYLWGWGWVLIPGAVAIYKIAQSVSSTKIAMKLEEHEQRDGSAAPEFVQVIQAYGAVLEAGAPALGTVIDSSKLPYPKQKIKEAIISALRSTDDPNIKEHLKFGYVQLAGWQDGVGEVGRGLDVSAFDTNQDAQTLAKAVLKQTTDSEVWITQSQKEGKKLEQELHELGLW